MRPRKKKNGEKRFEAVRYLVTEDISELESLTDDELEIGCGKGDFIVEKAKREPQKTFIAVERVKTVILTALEKAHAAGIKNIRFICADVSFDAGAEMAPTIVEKDATAIVCAADSLAMGIMRSAKNMGKAIPEDLSIVGFDDISSAKYTIPGLTTMKQDILEKARLAATLLLDDIKNKENGHKSYELAPELVVRGTVKTLKNS